VDSASIDVKENIVAAERGPNETETMPIVVSLNYTFVLHCSNLSLEKIGGWNFSGPRCAPKETAGRIAREKEPLAPELRPSGTLEA
jgi:hypothetical protein